MSAAKWLEKWIKRNWIWVVLLVTLIVVFDFIALVATNLVNTYSYFIFIIVTGIQILGTMVFIFKENPLRKPRLLLAYLLWWFGTDILAFPWLVTPTGLATTYGFSNLSSDVFIYQSLSWTGMPTVLLYNLVFIVVPMVLMYLGYRLSPKKKGFVQVVRMS